MANVNLNEHYPVTLQLQPSSPEIFDFLNSEERPVSINPSNTTVEVTNSRGGIIVERTSDGIFIDQEKLIIGYNWNTSNFSPQEYYTFVFRVSINYVTEWSTTDPKTPISTQVFILESQVTKALQSVNVFSS